MMEILCEIQEKYEECRKAKTAYLLSREEAKNMKEIWEGKREQLERLIADSTEPRLPFDKKGPPDGEEWRTVPLDDALGAAVSGAVLEKLREAEIATIGHLADYTQHQSLTDVAGIGPAKAEAIDQALEAFWARRKEEADQAATEEPEGEDENG